MKLVRKHIACRLVPIAVIKMVWCTRRRLVLQLEYIFENTQALLVYFSVSAVRGNFGSAALPAGLMKSNAEIEVGFRS